MLSIKHRSEKFRKSKQKSRICEHPGCGVSFMGLSRTKYCEGHRAAKYSQERHNARKQESVTFSKENLTINHKHVYAKRVKRVCSLGGCNSCYEIILLPKVYVYPKYCEEHRSAYKRELYETKRRGNITT